MWIIAATSDATSGATCRDERFREDLHFSASAVISFVVAPARERSTDIITLAELFLSIACQDYGLPRKRAESRRASSAPGVRWPGNVRELANLMERVVLPPRRRASIVFRPRRSLALGTPGHAGPRAGRDGASRGAGLGIDEHRQRELLRRAPGYRLNITKTARGS